jgi:hypothetical protein
MVEPLDQLDEAEILGVEREGEEQEKQSEAARHGRYLNEPLRAAISSTSNVR